MDIPLLSIPSKCTDDLDWAPSLQRYIQQQLGQDGGRFAAQCERLSQVRARACLDSDETEMRKSALLQYYTQLELLEMRCGISESSRPDVLFTW